MSSTNWIGRPPPNFTRSLYNSHILYDSHLRWDGITVINPVYTERTIPVTTWDNGRSPIGIAYTWDTATMTWNEATFTWDNANSNQTSWSGRTIP